MAGRTSAAQFDRVEALCRRGMAREEIAARVGLSVSTVRNILMGNMERPTSKEQPPAMQTIEGYLCQCGFRVVVKPCVICQALGRKKANASRY